MNGRSLAVVGSILLAGCAVEHPAVPASDNAELFMAQERLSPSAYASNGVVADVPSPKPDELTELPFITVSNSSNMIIRTASASIEVDSLQPAIAALNQLVTQFGGYVAGSGIEAGKAQLRKAFIEVKVPAERFDDLVAGLKPIGKLEAVNVKADDVGEEFVDVNARMDNARRLERRLIDLLATRTGKLKDVLDVEQSLARVREEIERYQGRLRYFQTHVAMSTLSVTVHEPLPVVGTAGTSVMGEAAAQAWRNFVFLIAFVVQSLGVVIPLAVIALVAWIVSRRWRRTISPQRAA